MIYFISDLHIKHTGMVGGIIKFERTCFNIIEQHDTAVKKAFNILAPEDEVWILGDIGYYDEWIKTIKSKKYLIMGNHDKWSKAHYENLFDKVYDHPVWFSPRIVLSHEPIPVEDDILNIHGHLHNSQLDKVNYLNVNIHRMGYKLCSLKQINKMLCKIPKLNDKYKFGHEWWINNQMYDSDVSPQYKPPLASDGRHIDVVKLLELEKM